MFFRNGQYAIHIFGLPADMNRILAIAEKHELAVVEDACQAWLAEYDGQMCGTLGDLGDQRAVDPLIAALKYSGKYGADVLRTAAAEALGELGDRRAVEPLVAALKDGNWAAAKAIVLLDVKSAVGPLIAALKDKDDQIRTTAARALAVVMHPYRRKDQEAALLAALDDSYREAREVAGLALGRRKVLAAAPKLRKMLSHTTEHRVTRAFAAIALIDLGDRRASRRRASCRSTRTTPISPAPS